jgi:hypothetical protein
MRPEVTRLLTTKAVVLIVIVLALSVAGVADECNNDQGFLRNPPLFPDSQPDIPLASMGINMPPAGRAAPDFDSSQFRSIAFNQNGNNVQSALSVTLTTVRVGFLYGVRPDLAAGISLPWKRTAIRGMTGGQDSTATIQSVGQILLGAKKLLYQGSSKDRVVLSGGIELPAGRSADPFDQTNSVTTAYFGYNRIPLGWEPSTNTVNGYLGVAYGREAGRFAYEGILAAKFYGTGTQDVSVGNIFIASATATYGISRKLAFSLGLTMRDQGNDSYPQAPSPGVQQPATAGTTTHSAGLYLDPSIRFTIFGKATIGAGFLFPIIQPEEGMVPEGTLSLILYPRM